MGRLRASFVVFAVGIAVSLLHMPLFPSLTIRDSELRWLWAQRVESGERFILRYTHSVARTQVDEVMRVEGRQIMVEASIYESFGAGLPSNPEGAQVLELSDGRLILSNIDLVQPYIEVRIGQVTANHQLLVHGRVIPLSSLGKPGTSVRFSIEKATLAKQLARRWRDVAAG